MKRFLKYFIPLVIVFFLLAFYLIFFVFSGLLTPFARACNRVQEGMSREEALSIMKNFENKKGVEFSEENYTLTYVTPGFSGDFQCYITLDDVNNVKYVTAIFD